MADKKDKVFHFVIVGGGIAGVTCVEQVTRNSYLNRVSSQFIIYIRTRCTNNELSLTAIIPDSVS